ncbi:glycosyl transferase [Aquibacillus halophilus]|uniref:Glycosyl transferase n=1 Tax=Aquibacillus halophilus TaxID=930132 RepID=A0A6A8DBJ4_9BACI|nr:glycoside hydrolase family 99-like domain-containing protein [Aquibacillus halophilus]MRH41229.1 glycosyl transferase [Aquibacillus halophilus]
MKILCMYLPQYHEIEENNEWWGEGYTEWTATKNAFPLFRGHEQPKVPLNENYYDLSDESADTWKWQAELAKRYNIYGFCVYHYWFKGKQLLQKPLEILLNNPQIDINYCICWANESWTRTWYGLEKEVLMKQEYGNRSDWKEHFIYLLKFFKDKRYIKVNNKPMLNIYRSSDINKLEEMLDFWNELAVENGFDGIYIVSANNNGELEKRENLIDAYYNFEPGYTLKHKLNMLQKLKYNINVLLRQETNRILKVKLLERIIDAKKINQMMLKRIENTTKPVFKGAYVMWDNTPRRSYKGLVYKNTSPDLLYETLIKIKSTLDDDDLNFVYLNAWNEWGEGCYLEPDKNNRYKNLEAVKKAVGENEVRE